MISQIHIKNFKSIVDLTLDLGRVNLFIGENGSGKSNILEAVAFFSIQDSIVANSALSLKGVRTTIPELYSSCFENEPQNISIEYIVDGFLSQSHYKLLNGNDNCWHDITGFEKSAAFTKFLAAYDEFIAYNPMDFIPYFTLESLKIEKGTPRNKLAEIKIQAHEFEEYYRHRYDNYIRNYIIYSPEVSYLRKFEEEGQIKPLGARGEGLFSLLKSMANDNGSLQHIKEYLGAIDWFEDFSIPNDLMSNEYMIAIKDRFINSELKYLDQRSANEGFLFLLFYIVLFSSKRTPQFFAIDNIEASFNPKLCSKLINMLVELSKKNNKQVLMTTHNPATLDGLDLNDSEQRLFVVRRNIDGHTIATRILEKPKVTAPMKLSEMWTKGLLGGLPDNF